MNVRFPGESAEYRAARDRLLEREIELMFPRDPGDERPGPKGGRTALLPLAEGPCPSCTALLDQLEGAAEHASQRINLAVVAKAQLSRLLTFAEERGWRLLRFLSSADNTYNRDYLAETPEDTRGPC